jgi:large subunit ribosomal protein L24
MNKLRTGDEVVVITGRDKGKRGTVSARVSDALLLVDGINQVKKHQKPNPMNNDVGGIVAKTMPIQQSNVAIFNAKTGKADRVGIKTLDNGSKVRVFRSSGDQIGAK